GISSVESLNNRDNGNPYLNEVAVTNSQNVIIDGIDEKNTTKKVSTDEEHLLKSTETPDSKNKSAVDTEIGYPEKLMDMPSKVMEDKNTENKKPKKDMELEKDNLVNDDTGIEEVKNGEKNKPELDNGSDINEGTLFDQTLKKEKGSEGKEIHESGPVHTETDQEATNVNDEINNEKNDIDESPKYETEKGNDGSNNPEPNEGDSKENTINPGKPEHVPKKQDNVQMKKENTEKVKKLQSTTNGVPYKLGDTDNAIRDI